MERKPIVAGNWKMFKTLDEAEALATEVRRLCARVRSVDVVVLPPFPFLHAVGKRIEGSRIGLGAQNLYADGFGAFTGEVSAPMLRSVGCAYVVVGHSERRHVLGETDTVVARKVKAALSGGLAPILCVGEKLDEREAGRTFEVVRGQIEEATSGLTPEQASTMVLAYEPVWAIGTGRTASSAQAQEVHRFAREILAGAFGGTVAERLRIQYGGSVKPGNAAELLRQPDIDGLLVGGASLEADSFSSIVASKAAE